MKKRFNVDSPSFTPSSLGVSASSQPTKALGLSPKAATAAPFKPKAVDPIPGIPASSLTAKPYNPNAPDWVGQREIPEFVPQTYNALQTLNSENHPDFSHSSTPFEQYTVNTPDMNALNHANQPAQINPYTQDTTGFNGSSYFQGSNYAQPLQHHLYVPQGPHRDPHPKQKMPRDFFIEEDLRQFLQKRSEATLKTFSSLPIPDVEQFHTLVNLDFSNSKTERFGYPSWLYKAMSRNDGHHYCLRRLEGFKATNESHKDVISVQQNWKRVRNGNVVSVHLAFTNSQLNGPSLFFVTDYHPCAETLAQKHFGGGPSRYSNRHNAPQITEQVLWAYVVQIAYGLKAIHDAGLAAKVIDATKVILTSENRIRLNGCAILDVAQGQATESVAQQQCRDLCLFGNLLLALGTNNASTTSLKGSQSKALDMFRRNYTPRLVSSLGWLLEHASSNTEPISNFLSTVAPEAAVIHDATLHNQDHLYSALNRELENSRITRMMIKISSILGRPEHEHDGAWSPQGHRYMLLLVRDYIFQQVDATGRPVSNLAHIVGCLNRLDAGSEERISLTSRDNSTVMIVSWKEIKTCFEGAWNELHRGR